MDKPRKIIRCAIADDEPVAREIISRFCSRVPSLEVVAECANAIQVMEVLKQEQVDLLFLDIHMPELRGTDMLRILDTPPFVVITTAFQEYALEGYELDVADYLLKPIKFERFLKAVNKIFKLSGQSLPGMPRDTEKSDSRKASYLHFRTDRKTVKVLMDDILFIEGMGNYVKIITHAETIITKNSMTTVETMLPEDQFVRVHRSFIVSRDKVKSFNTDSLQVGKHEIPIGKHFKNNVLRLLSEE